jgi:hypothetical protein
MRKLLLIAVILALAVPCYATQYRDDYYGFGTDSRFLYAGGGDQYLFIVDSLGTTNGTPDSPPCDNGSNPSGWTEVKCGTFREAITYANSVYSSDSTDGTAIVFEESGNIDSGSTSHISYNLTAHNVIIAGQTAPFPGIILHNVTLNVTGSDVLVQHMRIRGGYDATSCDRSGFLANVPSSIPASSHTTNNVVFEHCSVAWQLDEGFGIGDMSDVTQTVTNVSVIYGLSAQGLDCTGTYSSDSKGFLLFRSDFGTVNNISVIKSMSHSNRYRHPYSHADAGIYNMVVFNAKDMAIRGDEGGSQGMKFTLSHSYNLPGNMSNSTVSNNFATLGASPTGSEFYIVGNQLDGTAQQADWEDWAEVNDPDNIEGTAQHVSSAPSGTSPTNISSFLESNISTMATDVKTYAGAFPASRDGLDTHLISEYDAETGISSVLTAQPAACGTQPCYETLTNNTHDLDNSPSSGDSIPTSPHTVLGNNRTNFEEWLISFAVKAETGTFGEQYTDEVETTDGTTSSTVSQGVVIQ